MAPRALILNLWAGSNATTLNDGVAFNRGVDGLLQALSSLQTILFSYHLYNIASDEPFSAFLLIHENLNLCVLLTLRNHVPNAGLICSLVSAMTAIRRFLVQEANFAALVTHATLFRRWTFHAFLTDQEKICLAQVVLHNENIQLAQHFLFGDCLSEHQYRLTVVLACWYRRQPVQLLVDLHCCEFSFAWEIWNEFERGAKFRILTWRWLLRVKRGPVAAVLHKSLHARENRTIGQFNFLNRFYLT